jgi:hypothetical protein
VTVSEFLSPETVYVGVTVAGEPLYVTVLEDAETLMASATVGVIDIAEPVDAK